MKAKKNKIWILFLTSFILTQLTLTIIGRNLWPFSSHTFFAFNIPEVAESECLVYYDNNGRSIKADASAFMPIEFFKAHRIAKFVMDSPEIPISRKIFFFKKIFNIAKNHPWKRFDETYPSIYIPKDFIPVRVEISMDYETYDYLKYGVTPLIKKMPPLSTLKLEGDN